MMTNDIAAENANVSSQIGTLLAERYRIDAVIGRGGMATVYRATDEALGRTVALKIFRGDLADAEDVRRQHEEIRLIAGLNHFALVTLFDAVADDSSGEHGRAFIVMQFIDGTDLRHRLNAGPLDPRTAAMVGADLAEALAYVHDRGVVHRDIKPANILLPNRENEATGPQAMLADFGIARIVDGTRLTATGSVLGTANYLSPEQAVGSALSPATDVYSLGLVLLESLTGEKSFPGSAIESVSARLARDPVIPDRFGAAWVELLRSMTAREPSIRIDATSAASALRRLALDGQAGVVDALDPTLRYPTSDLQTTVAIAEVVPAGLSPRDRHGPGARPLGLARHPRRRAAIAVGIAIVAIMAATGTWAIVASNSPPPTAPAMHYPAVSGDLGAHLEQLQTAVAP